MVTLRSLDDQTQFHIKEGESLILGRMPKCDLVLEDPSVSSQHARLRQKDNRLRVVDMGSTNGTRVNYAMLNGAGHLQDGDTVEFGNVSFVVDGPGLLAPPEEENPMRSTMDLDPLRASQEIEDTMLNIPMPSGEDLDAELSVSQGEGGPGEEFGGDADRQLHDEPVEESGHPSFLTALGLILLAGLALVAYLWSYTPRY